MWSVFVMRWTSCGVQIGSEMNVHTGGSRAAGWSSGWKWNSSICKVGGGRGGRPIDSSFGEGVGTWWASCGGQQGSWWASASAYPQCTPICLIGNQVCCSVAEDRFTEMFECNALLCTGLGSQARSSQLDFCVPPPPAIMHHSAITSCARKYQLISLIMILRHYYLTEPHFLKMSYSEIFIVMYIPSMFCLPSAYVWSLFHFFRQGFEF